ncbi:hypothetical protein Acr_18g0007900 [Actinidia rufa]|uniref:Uncharacterized protein n=1 Tax=Actinidia rufa TaxID=165716 RepID=A0A7J0G749_9ERIC|nr:hypothetical protein Acr_18g0007900 [Actinidia rufa]
MTVTPLDFIAITSLFFGGKCLLYHPDFYQSQGKLDKALATIYGYMGAISCYTINRMGDFRPICEIWCFEYLRPLNRRNNHPNLHVFPFGQCWASGLMQARKSCGTVVSIQKILSAMTKDQVNWRLWANLNDTGAGHSVGWGPPPPPANMRSSMGLVGHRLAEALEGRVRQWVLGCDTFSSRSPDGDRKEFGLHWKISLPDAEGNLDIHCFLDSKRSNVPFPNTHCGERYNEFTAFSFLQILTFCDFFLAIFPVLEVHEHPRTGGIKIEKPNPSQSHQSFSSRDGGWVTMRVRMRLPAFIALMLGQAGKGKDPRKGAASDPQQDLFLLL